MAERIVEGDVGAHHVAVGPRKVLERVLLVLVARAKYGHLDTALHEAVHRVAYESQALLVGEAPDHDHERTLRILPESKFLLEGLLVLGLLRKGRDTVLLRDHLVGLGVPDMLVNTIQNAVQHVGTAAEDTIHPLAKEGHLQLARIARAHRGDDVGVAERTLHEIDGVPIAVKLPRRRGVVGQPKDVGEHLVGVLPLKLHVVDGEDRLDVPTGI